MVPAGIETLSGLIADACRIAIFTGAGLSTESGIPDFRSPGGVWSRMKPIPFEQFLNSEAMRREAWRRTFDGTAGWVGGTPNQGHQVVARLAASGKVTGIITQNVDNLHQDSGVPPDLVIELHGNASYAACLQCARRCTLEELRRPFVEENRIPRCTVCGGLVKVATISFGQSLPRAAMTRAREVAMTADLFIVLGSSLTVQPAAFLPVLAHQHGGTLAIINRDATPLDRVADLVIHGELGAVLSELALD